MNAQCKLQLMTIAWGEKHIEMFRLAALRSLSSPKNKRVLYENKAVWNFFTEEKYFHHIEKIMYAYLPEIELVLRSKVHLRDYIDPVQSAAIMMIKSCIESETKLMMAPPDTIWGDGSVNGVVKVGREKGTCVLVPHVRVLPSILEEDLTPFVTNQELVSLSWKKNEDGTYAHLHRSWSEAEVGHILQNSFVGGVAWQKIEDHIFEVRHRLPTVYLADFTNEDLQYFKTAISFGHWDHTWPGDILVKRGRQRVIGGSDIAFMAEITEKDKNVPPLWEGSPDDFWRKHPHNEMNKQYSAVFRGMK